jgi:hypothetical protein
MMEEDNHHDGINLLSSWANEQESYDRPIDRRDAIGVQAMRAYMDSSHADERAQKMPRMSKPVLE